MKCTLPATNFEKNVRKCPKINRPHTSQKITDDQISTHLMKCTQFAMITKKEIIFELRCKSKNFQWPKLAPAPKYPKFGPNRI